MDWKRLKAEAAPSIWTLVGSAPCAIAEKIKSLAAISVLAVCLNAGATQAEALAPNSQEPPIPSEPPTSSLALERIANGKRVFYATGGCTCHTNYPGEGEDAPELAGGRGLETPFGIFFSTNITPDTETGIGKWSDADFIRAMREGLSPKGEHYFPVFPYSAFAGLLDQDLVDLKSYLDSLPPVTRINRAPDAPFPFTWRATISGWKWMNFEMPSRETSREKSAEWNRGRYLVDAAAHCGECHTPRTLTGGLDASLHLAGSQDGPEGQLAPNITPHETTGIGRWSRPDLVWYLETGLKPDGDDTQGLMSEVIEHGYANLPASDLEAMAVYLRTVPAIENHVKGE